ncbi:MAG: rhodanese-like domain-containing protein [Pseudomonadota bacterium]
MFFRLFRSRVIKNVFLVAAALLMMTVTAMADTPILSAPEAQTQVATGDLVLLDIRSPQEWRDTGVAEGAWPVSMHEPDFGQRLQAILTEVGADRIGLICATGGRTAHVASILKQNGIEGVTDVSEGMMGNPRGPGWIARSMPVVSLEDATAAYEAAVAGW